MIDLKDRNLRAIVRFIKDEFSEESGIIAMYEKYIRRAEAFDYGRNRCVFLFDKYVVKLPKNHDGIADNDWEGSVSNDHNTAPCEWQVQFPRTRLAYVNELSIVFMERIEAANEKEIRRRLGYVPKWVDCVDCGQVGFTRSGKLVAYDYGYR